MKYQSTRYGKGSGERYFSFSDAIITGLAPDGGLLVPVAVPRVSREQVLQWRTMNYKNLCYAIMRLYISPKEIPDSDLRYIISRSYSRFRSEEISPVCENGGFFFLELFHGPTYSFKDVALQFLGTLFDYLLQKREGNLVVLGATSGDTGSAAIAGLRGKQNIDCVILYPEGKISRIQELQMTTCCDQNVHCVAVEGTFDDCQSLVKATFNSPLKERLHLGAVNSINWGRILAQMVYYWYASFRVLEKTPTAFAVDFSVPTGNFGNILAGYYAKCMGAPIGNLIIATNSNDILARCHSKGEYRPTEVVPTMSPAMDIQVSSNFERYIHELLGSKFDGEKFKALGPGIGFNLEGDSVAKMQEQFSAYSATEEETEEAIKYVFTKHGKIIDPHTAVSYVGARKFMASKAEASSKATQDGSANPMVVVCSAHFGKFYDTVAAVLGARALIDDMPEELSFLDQLSTRNDRIQNSPVQLQKYLNRRFHPNLLHKAIDWCNSNPLSTTAGIVAVLGMAIAVFSTRRWA